MAPFVEWASLLSYTDVASFWDASPRGILGRHALDAVAMCWFALASYGLRALALTRGALRTIRRGGDGR